MTRVTLENSSRLWRFNDMDVRDSREDHCVEVSTRRCEGVHVTDYHALSTHLKTFGTRHAKVGCRGKPRQNPQPF